MAEGVGLGKVLGAGCSANVFGLWPVVIAVERSNFAGNLAFRNFQTVTCFAIEGFGKPKNFFSYAIIYMLSFSISLEVSINPMSHLHQLKIICAFQLDLCHGSHFL